jgi:hypothetical protein
MSTNLLTVSVPALLPTNMHLLPLSRSGTSLFRSPMIPPSPSRTCETRNLALPAVCPHRQPRQMELPETDGHFSLEHRSEDAPHGHPLLLAGATPAQAPVGSGRRHSLGNDPEPVRLRRPRSLLVRSRRLTSGIEEAIEDLPCRRCAKCEAVTRQQRDFPLDGLSNGHAVANYYSFVAA